MQNAAICTWPAYVRHRYIIPTGARSGYTAKRLHVVTKTLLVMKLTCLLLTAAFLNVSATGISQYVSFSGENIALEHVFTIVEKQTGYVFFYNAETLKETKPVTINAENMPLKDFLKKIMAGQPVKYVIRSKSISVSKRMEFIAADLSSQLNVELPPVSGVVHGADGQPLGGVNIVIKGTKKGTTSSGDGKFSIEAKEGDVLIFTSIGYGQKEIRVGAYIVIGIVQLSVSESKLDEIQIIAYGKTTHRLSTGNTVTIKADVIEKQPVNNPLLALSGRVPGLFIEQATGFAGTGVKVRIQGQNSLRNGSDPLYIIDGVPFNSQLLLEGNPVLGSPGVLGINSGSPFAFINPADIESIDVLKDADATAIYGSRAANGAILITTKKGKSGNTRVNLNLQSGWSKVPKRLDLMNSEQYLEMRKEALKNDGIINLSSSPYQDSDLNGTWDSTRNTDWQKELIGKTAAYQDLNISFSGGSDRTTFLLGTGYHRETNVFPGNYSDRKASLHFSLNNTSANQKFKLQFSGNYLFDNNQLPTIDLTGNAMTLSPVSPALYGQDGSINWQPNDLGNSTFPGNPIGYTFNKFLSKANNLTGNMVLSYQISRGLEVKSSFGYNTLSTKTTTKNMLQAYYPELRKYVSRSTIFGSSNTNSWTIEPQLFYHRNIAKGKLDILLGATFLENNSTASDIFASGFSSDLVMDDIKSAPIVRSGGTSIETVYKYDALFGRINYNWQDKYIINLTARRDGSSRFGPRSQFHNFGAIGGAWIFSNESLIKNKSGLLSFGKLRGSYGTTGSDQIGDYKTLSLYDPIQQSKPYQGITAYEPNGLANPYLEWERTTKMQLGIDLGFLKNRILINANYYRNHSSNQLEGYSLPSTTGFYSITKNQTYKIRNSGWELMLSTENIRGRDFTWSSSVNLTIPKTLLVDYPDIVKSSASGTAIIGMPLSVVSVYHFMGIDPLSGFYQFADMNGNPTTSPNDLDSRLILIDLAPKFYGGFQNTFIYKNFQLDFLFSFVKQIGQNATFGIDYSVPGTFNGGSGNKLTNFLDRWEKPGDVSYIQRFSTDLNYFQSLVNLRKSDAVWNDASYIRLKNLSFSWSLPEHLKKNVHLQKCSLFVQGQNIFTITRYTGLDAETRSSTSLPPLRVISMGVNVGL